MLDMDCKARVQLNKKRMLYCEFRAFKPSNSLLPSRHANVCTHYACFSLGALAYDSPQVTLTYLMLQPALLSHASKTMQQSPPRLLESNPGTSTKAALQNVRNIPTQD